MLGRSRAPLLPLALPGLTRSARQLRLRGRTALSLPLPLHPPIGGFVVFFNHFSGVGEGMGCWFPAGRTGPPWRGPALTPRQFPGPGTRDAFVPLAAAPPSSGSGSDGVGDTRRGALCGAPAPPASPGPSWHLGGERERQVGGPKTLLQGLGTHAPGSDECFPQERACASGTEGGVTRQGSGCLEVGCPSRGPGRGIHLPRTTRYRPSRVRMQLAGCQKRPFRHGVSQHNLKKRCQCGQVEALTPRQLYT